MHKTILLENEIDFLITLLARTRIFIPDNIFYASYEKIVAIAGAGGIESKVIEMLVRWGIKRFRIADMDKFEF